MRLKRLLAGALTAILLLSSATVAMADDCKHVPGEIYELDYVPCNGGWKAVDESYPYDYYYSCENCYLVIDEEGNELIIDYFEADPDAKHTPDFSEECPADYLPCVGGYKEAYYYCSGCGTSTDADGNEVEYSEADPDARHNPDLEGDCMEASYTTCSGGYKENRYLCIDCMTWVSAEGIDIEREEGDGKHTPNKDKVYEANWTPCGGGYKMKYYECANGNCGEFVDAKGKEMKYVDADEDAKHDLEHIPELAATCEEDGFVEYWVCKACGDKFEDENGENYLWFEEDYVIPATGHTLEKVEKVEATYEAEGCKEHWKCEVCGKLFEDEDAVKEIKDEKSLAIPKLEKTPVEEDKEQENDKKEEISKEEKPSKVPETGDASQIGLLMSLMAVSIMCFVSCKKYMKI